MTDPNGHVTKKTYDSRGDVTSEVDPLGNTKTYSYDGLGDLLAATDALGVTTSYQYDGLGDLLSISTPLTGGGAATTSYIRQRNDGRGDAHQHRTGWPRDQLRL